MVKKFLNSVVEIYKFIRRCLKQLFVFFSLFTFFQLGKVDFFFGCWFWFIGCFDVVFSEQVFRVFFLVSENVDWDRWGKKRGVQNLEGIVIGRGVFSFLVDIVQCGEDMFDGIGFFRVEV